MKKNVFKALTVLNALTVAIAITMLASCNVQNASQGTETEIVTEEHVHSFADWTTVTGATCTGTGTEIGVCACGEKSYREVETLGHLESQEEIAVASTCQSKGMTAATHCERCGIEMTAAHEVDKSEHQWNEYGVCTGCGTIRGAVYTSNGDGTCTMDTPFKADNGIPDFEKSLEDCGFKAENGLLVIPTVSPDGDRVTEVKDATFNHCSSVVNMIVPDDVKLWGSQSNPHLSTMYIPASVDMSHSSCLAAAYGDDARATITIYTGYESDETWSVNYGTDGNITIIYGVTLEEYMNIISGETAK